jgi:hypothetical protein
MLRLFSAAAGFALLLSAVAPAVAQAVDYAYTPIDLKQCKHSRDRIEGFGIWLCPGYDGIAILISSAEQHSFVSFGANAKKELANRDC